jgi:MFS transporter, ACS family, hexuronate transporter
MLLVSLISYLDRNTLALLAPAILADTGLTGEQYGFLISAFSLAYMAANPLWGRLLDRFGLALGMPAAVLFWTLASASHAWASGFWSFALARFALGFGEGATFPGGLRTVTQTLPLEKQGRGLAIAYSGGSLGAVITPLLVTPIALRWGWRAAFLFTGLTGLAWLALWAFVARRPDIRQRKLHEAKPVAAPRPRDPAFWGMILIYALGALPLAFVLYQGAIYLARARGLSQGTIGALLWIPPLGWEIGYFFWGWLLDRMGRSGFSRVEAVSRLTGASAVLSLPLALVPWMGPVWLILAELFFAMFLASGFILFSLSYATHVYTSSHSALIAGIGAGSWSAAVAIAMPLFGRLFDRELYGAAFGLAAAAPLAGYLGWRALLRYGGPRANHGAKL